MCDLSDEALCDRWIENPYFRVLFTYFDERLEAWLRWKYKSLKRPKDLARVVVDTTMQPKAVMFPTDAKLLNRARERLVSLAAHVGVELRKSYSGVGKLALIKHQRYAHAHQFKRANRSLRGLKIYLAKGDETTRRLIP
jgi:IS5 family transposase